MSMSAHWYTPRNSLQLQTQRQGPQILQGTAAHRIVHRTYAAWLSMNVRWCMTRNMLMEQLRQCTHNLTDSPSHMSMSVRLHMPRNNQLQPILLPLLVHIHLDTTCENFCMNRNPSTSCKSMNGRWYMPRMHPQSIHILRHNDYCSNTSRVHTKVVALKRTLGNYLGKPAEAFDSDE
jgi:hypothetical protein